MSTPGEPRESAQAEAGEGEESPREAGEALAPQLGRAFLAVIAVAALWLLASLPFLAALAIGAGLYLLLHRRRHRPPWPARTVRASEGALVLSAAASGALLGKLGGWAGVAVGAAVGGLAGALAVRHGLRSSPPSD